MGFLTGLWFPQILISICQPEKGLTYIMLLHFGTALSSERGSGLGCRREGVCAECDLDQIFNLTVVRDRFFSVLFFLLNKSINYLCPRFPLESFL